MKLESKVKAIKTSKQIGLFFEDINFAADGGLYAEMIENRSFEARDAIGGPGNYYSLDDFGYAWHPVSDESGTMPEMQYVTGRPLSSSNPHYLRLTSSGAGQGFSNKAYDGIHLQKGNSYRISFYARCISYETDIIRIVIRKGDREYVSLAIAIQKPVSYSPYCDTTIPMDLPYAHGNSKNSDILQQPKQDEWIFYEAYFEASEDLTGGAFQILTAGPGVIEFDFISMFPGDAVAGLFRKDLFCALQYLHPGFLRFPGGCIVEGISLDNRYNWKKTIGAPIHRPYMQNLWAYEDDRRRATLTSKRKDSHYGQSFGLGFYEYFILCELLGASPLPVLNIGCACQFRSTELVASNSDDFQTYIQDALDLIEFANNSPDTPWGKVRASMGHPAPFGLEMIGIGNEQWETTSLDFQRRYTLFEKCIHAKYPDIKLIGSAGPAIDIPIYNQALDFYRSHAEKEDFCYAVDEHYYITPAQMYQYTFLYDDYPRNVGVFAGEYAAHTEEKANNIESALAEAALLTGLEKNGDIVKLACYAPLFHRISHGQWKPDLIWFDDTSVYLTPNYYVQALFSNYTGNKVLDLDGQDRELQSKGIYVSVVQNNLQTILKLVNTNSTAYTLNLEFNDCCKDASSAHCYLLAGSGKHYLDNRENPEIPSLQEIDMELSADWLFPPQSLSVIIIQ